MSIFYELILRNLLYVILTYANILTSNHKKTIPEPVAYGVIGIVF